MPHPVYAIILVVSVFMNHVCHCQLVNRSDKLMQRCALVIGLQHSVMHIPLMCLFLRSSVRQTADSIKAIQTVANSDQQNANLSHIAATAASTTSDAHRFCRECVE